MSITSTRNSLCQGMNQGYAGITGPIRAANASLNTLWNQIESGLYTLKNTVGFNDTNVLNDAIADLKDDARAYYPGDQLEDMQEIQRLIEQCVYLNGLQPVASLIAGITGLFDEIDDLIAGISFTLPEFGIGSLIGAILDALKSIFPGGLSLSDLLAQAEDLINCLANLCGSGFIPQADLYATDLTNLYADLHLYDSGPYQGLPMLDELYDSIGMTSIEKAAMDIVNEGIEATKIDALAAVDSSIASVKSFTTLGGIFG